MDGAVATVAEVDLRCERCLDDVTDRLDAAAISVWYKDRPGRTIGYRLSG